MLSVKVFCPECLEEDELVVDELDAVDREVCACGFNLVLLSVSEFSPVRGRAGDLIELPPRRSLRRAA